MARGRFTIDEQIENCNKKIAELQEKKAALIEKKKQEEESAKNQEKKHTIETVIQLLKSNDVSLEEIEKALMGNVDTLSESVEDDSRGLDTDNID